MSEHIGRRTLRCGSLYTWSVVHVAKGWKVPYIAGYVDLPEGVRIFAHIVEAGSDELNMDMKVSLTTSVLGENENGPVKTAHYTGC